MDVEYAPYPKWLYHKTAEATLVHTAERHAQLGAGWYESPREAAAEIVAPVIVAPPAPAPVAEAPPDPAAAALQKYYAAPGQVIYAKVQTLSVASELEDLRAIEEQRPGGARKTVLRRINERLGRLRGAQAAEREDTDGFPPDVRH